MSLLSSRPSPAVFACLLFAAACGGGYADPSREFAPAPTGERHGTRIHTPETLGVVDTEQVDVHGTPIGVACETCHGDPDAPAGAAMVAARGNPDGFHGSLELEHGALSCAACHDDTERSRLHLADGTSLPMAAAMDLCAQCHGPQTRDYRHGSHGGMTGHWDLRAGPRERNHCLDCHDAHQPAFVGGLPVAPAVDRSRTPSSGVH